MVDQPNPVGPNAPTPKVPSNTPTNSSSDNWNPPPLTWMGMHFNADETKKLWTTIMQSVSTEIQREEKRMKEANRRLRRSIEGKEP